MSYQIQRDITWLDFNYRVLQEAKDQSVPLFERLKFLAIFSSNLDEFFKVRVANHRNYVRSGAKQKVKEFSQEDILQKIQKKVKKHQEEFSSIFTDEIIPALKDNGIRFLKRGKLIDEERKYIENYFETYMQAYVHPVLIVEKKVKPFLVTGALYLALNMEDKEDGSHHFAIVAIPSNHLPRFIELPTSKEGDRRLMFLDDIVRHNIKEVFPGFNIVNSFSIKLTRDAELYIDDEYSGDLVSKIQESLNRREIGVASRLVYDRRMPQEMISYFKNAFDLSDYDLLPEGRYHSNSDFFRFPSFGMSQLQNQPLPPLMESVLENASNILDEIEKKDHMIHPPYHSYESVVKFFEDAAVDPDVTHIKIIQYRVASESRIMEALMRAVRNGKHVSAFVEVKARFDEEANLRWGSILEKAGVNVHYSMPGLKVHSKTAVVRRVKNGKERLFCYLGTGNFHEKTAKIYSDIGVFTADKRLTSEAARVLTYLETKVRPEKEFKLMGVGQFNLKAKLKKHITTEIENHQKGLPSGIFLKMNSLQDEEMVNLLYTASKAGVKVKLVIRGICTLVPGIPGMSDNITAISIVDRFLEHARIFVFENGGSPRMYLSSADLMSRNLHRRVETMFPILDQDIFDHIQFILDLQWNDNVKSRYIHMKKNNKYRKSGDVAVRSQYETYLYLKRIEDRALLHFKNQL